jgi:hypothetical protein
MAGYDTASTIQSVGPGALSEFGANPLFWIRYFSPSPAADCVNSSAAGAVDECVGLWDYNDDSPCLGVISEPSQSHLSGSSAQGQADAQQYIASLLYVYDNVGPLQYPTNDTLWCWLGQEASTTLSSGYWTGWATYVNDYGGPMHAALYCDPEAPPPNCSVIDNYNGTSSACYAVWSSEPEYTSYCAGGLTSSPAWAAESCSDVGTRLWQYAEQGVCGYSADVDLDEGAPGYNYKSWCFYLSSQP